MCASPLPQPPPRPAGTLSNLLSATERLAMSDHVLKPPFVVTEAVSKVYSTTRACPPNRPSSLPPNPTLSKNQLAPRPTLSSKGLGSWVTTPSLVLGTTI